MNTFLSETLVPILMVAGIVWFFISKAKRSLNPGLRKVGKGKKAKGGGDAVASWTEAILLSIAKGAGRAMFHIATLPFRAKKPKKP